MPPFRELAQEVLMVAQRHVAFMAVTILTACASAQPVELQPRGQASSKLRPVTIRVVEDTIPLFRSQKGATLRATIRVYNGSDRVLYVERGCGRAALQRQLGTEWQTVWDNQNCLMAAVSPQSVARGDSALVYVAFWGTTGVSRELAGWPPMDPRVEPGVYRFAVKLGSAVDESGMQMAKLLPMDERASDAFPVRQVRRP